MISILIVAAIFLLFLLMVQLNTLRNVDGEIVEYILAPFFKLGKLIGEDVHKKMSPRHHLPKGPPEKAIVKMAKELRADVVVMGTIARTGIAGFIIGNTAETILDQLTCSVLAVKPPGFVTPVRLDG